MISAPPALGISTLIVLRVPQNGPRRSGSFDPLSFPSFSTFPHNTLTHTLSHSHTHTHTHTHTHRAEEKALRELKSLGAEDRKRLDFLRSVKDQKKAAKNATDEGIVMVRNPSFRRSGSRGGAAASQIAPLAAAPEFEAFEIETGGHASREPSRSVDGKKMKRMNKKRKKRVHTGRCCCCCGFATDTAGRRVACVFTWLALLVIVAGGLVGALIASNILLPGLLTPKVGQSGGGDASDGGSGGGSGGGSVEVVVPLPTYKVEAAVSLDLKYTDIVDMASFEEGAQSSIATALNVSTQRVVITSVTPGYVARQVLCVCVCGGGGGTRTRVAL